MQFFQSNFFHLKKRVLLAAIIYNIMAIKMILTWDEILSVISFKSLIQKNQNHHCIHF